MEKSIIIIGPQGSGKTTLAVQIASQFKKDEVAIIPFSNHNNLSDPFLFSQCSKETKLIVFDELPPFWFNQFFEKFTNPISVNKKDKKSFPLNPKFILVFQRTESLDIEITEMGSTVFDHFNIIKSGTHTSLSKFRLTSIHHQPQI